MRPIGAKDARAFVEKHHYSGTTVNNSTLHLGVFLKGFLGGVMQFGCPIDKRKVIGLVEGTAWNGFLELNRMAFSDLLPRNSESRALSVAFRIIKKNYPHIEWILSFSDGCSCGDGTIYRASGFVLTQIRENKTIWVAPDGKRHSDLGLRLSKTTMTKGKHLAESGGASSMKRFADMGYRPLEGYQLRYIYFLNPAARERLTCPVLPFSEIARMGAGMYKGKKREGSKENVASGVQPEEGGANPTPLLQPSKKKIRKPSPKKAAKARAGAKPKRRS